LSVLLFNIYFSTDKNGVDFPRHFVFIIP